MKRFSILAVVVMAALPLAAHAITITTPDPLLGFCWGSSSCADNGNNTPVVVSGNGPQQFGFNVSSGPGTGDDILKFLVPTNATGAFTQTIIVDVTQAGPSNTTSFTTGAATLFSSTAWSSGTLQAYLGGTFALESPTNPIGNYLGTSLGGFNTSDPTASAYAVYTLDLGAQTISSTSAGSNGTPKMAINTASSGLPVGSYILDDFLNTNLPQTNIATANSGALLLTTPCVTCGNSGEPFPPVPEPASLLIFGTGLLALGMVRTVRRA